MPSDTAVPRYCTQCGTTLGAVTAIIAGQEVCQRCAPTMPSDTYGHDRGFYLELPSSKAFRSRGELSITEQSTVASRCPYCGTLENVKDHTDTCPVGQLEARTPSDDAVYAEPETPAGDVVALSELAMRSQPQLAVSHRASIAMRRDRLLALLDKREREAADLRARVEVRDEALRLFNDWVQRYLDGFPRAAGSVDGVPAYFIGLAEYARAEVLAPQTAGDCDE